MTYKTLGGWERRRLACMTYAIVRFGKLQALLMIATNHAGR